MRLVVSVVLACALIAACGGVTAETSSSTLASAVPDTTVAVTAAPPTTKAAPADPAPPTSTTRSPAPHNVAEIDLVAYIEIIEHMLDGTAYEGTALEAPHVFLATGSLFCDELDAGIPADEILFGYIETLSGGPVEEASDDDLTMAGAVLGSGLAALCPHNIAAIGESG